jgi:hypothetical protein
VIPVRYELSAYILQKRNLPLKGQISGTKIILSSTFILIFFSVIFLITLKSLFPSVLSPAFVNKQFHLSGVPSFYYNFSSSHLG